MKRVGRPCNSYVTQAKPNVSQNPCQQRVFINGVSYQARALNWAFGEVDVDREAYA